MAKIFRNNKGIAPLLIVLIILGVLALIYVILLLPIPAFTSIRYTINYWSILILLIAIQVGLIFLVYEIISYARKGLNNITKLDKDWLKSIRQWVTIKFR